VKRLNQHEKRNQPQSRTRSRPPNHRKNDILWKVVLEEVFDDLLRFIFPDADRVYDMERGFEFLDKELSEMYPEPRKESATRFADKLVKVFRRDGEEDCILCHIEIQGETKKKDRPLFAERMVRYFYRIWDKYRKPVSAVAIFTGRDGKKMPDRFEYAYRNTRLLYQYPTISILDFTDDQLEKSDNPFAQVILAARTSLLEGKIPPADLLDRKVLIARKLLRKGFSLRKIRAIFVFLENYVAFDDPEMNLNFKNRIESKDKNNIMGIDEYLKQVGREEGLAEGLEKGKEESNRLFVENLLKEGFPTKKIASLANVTLAFIKTVKADLKG
jgi:predicted transposase YdaD